MNMDGNRTKSVRSAMVGLLLVAVSLSPMLGVGAAGGPPACNDGKDNDGDGLTDYPDDPGCDTKGDKDEAGAGSPPPRTTLTRQWHVTCTNDPDRGMPGMGLDGVSRGEFPIPPEKNGQPYDLRMELLPVFFVSGGQQEPVPWTASVEFYDESGARLNSLQSQTRRVFFGSSSFVFNFTGTVPSDAAWAIAFECNSRDTIASFTV